MFRIIILSLCLYHSFYAMHDDETNFNLPLPPLYEDLFMEDDKSLFESDTHTSSLSLDSDTQDEEDDADESSDDNDSDTVKTKNPPLEFNPLYLVKVKNGFICPVSKECKIIRGREKRNVLSHTIRQHARCTCDITIEFTSKEQLIDHLNQHQGTTAMVKSLLQYKHKLFEPVNLQQSVKKSKNSNKCCICSKILATVKSLKTHMKNIHQSDISTKFLNKEDFAHRVVPHTRNNSNNRHITKLSKRKSAKKRSQEISCESCGNTFTEKRSLCLHMAEVHHACIACDPLKGYLSAQELVDHLSSHPEKPAMNLCITRLTQQLTKKYGNTSRRKELR